MVSYVLVRSVVTNDHVLVKVMADGRQLGVLAFTDDQWREIEQHGGVQIYVAKAMAHRA